MYIEDQAIIINTAKFQENSLIVSCFTRNYGVIKGLVKSKKSITQIVPASLVHLTHKARLETQLGFLKIENIRNYISLIAFDRTKLKIINCLLAILGKLLHERDQHTSLYDAFNEFLEKLNLQDSTILNLKAYALLELKILTEAGYGLDLSKCVVTESQDDLIYISPKSGCAVSKDSGKPYHNKLFKMPNFYVNFSVDTTEKEVIRALDINKFFLEKRIFEPNNMNLPQERVSLSNEIKLDEIA